MGSMHVGLEEAPDGFARMAAFYAERARAGVGLIVTGGIAPTTRPVLTPVGEAVDPEEATKHRVVTEAVHAEGGRIAMQILHFGRYAYHPDLVGPSPIQAPISPFPPRELTAAEVERTIEDFVTCAALAKDAGYDGVEVMGSEGYFINEFISARTNHRTDDWGGSYENRMRLPVAIVKGVRGGSDRTSSSSTDCRCSTSSRTARPRTRSSSSPRPSRRPARRSSTPASAGTRPGSRRSRPACPGRPSPG